ncbi:hypothetical protein F5X97DRAFT_342470 [Nemania serpens]|nr:hypothetical protein F5X97DRAFT_342470 [Nemania serpens]
MAPRRSSASAATAPSVARNARRRAARNAAATANAAIANSAPTPQAVPQAAAQQGGSAQDVAEQPQIEQAAPQAPKFRCRDCPKEFAKNSILQTHVNDRHVGRVCYWPQCGSSFETEGQLIQHFQQHQRQAITAGFDPKACPWPRCEKEFSRRDTVQRCIKRHNNQARPGN